MSAEALARFVELVLDDDDLQRRLLALPDRREFVPAVAAAAADRGLAVTGDDVEQALRAARRSWLERWV